MVGGNARDLVSELKRQESGRFASSPIPSEPGDASSSVVSSATPDAFGLVLSIGGIQPIWQLTSLFCYKGLWQDHHREGADDDPHGEGIEVILTIAIGPPPHYMSDSRPYNAG